ncbi:enoyl-CoA hydratase [Streptomyces sp. NPDC051018]|uniref:enoyl-CoA hydratase n=1 Tax=Streptomyces sp. NPDC051018 TaxID=3365639 RepID=UPI0037886378
MDGMTDGTHRRAAGAEPPVLVARAGRIATLTLNRPRVRNALNAELIRAMRRELAVLDRDPDIDAIVLTGADPAFCAGLDLRELGDSGRNVGTGNAEGIPAGRAWAPLSTPVIGAVNGPAVAGGLEIALNCDFLIASERAVFADTHARVGVMPGWGVSVLLPERVGFATARRMSLTGDFVGAAEALRTGLVTEVVAHGALAATALRVAGAMSGDHRGGVAAMLASSRRIEAAALGKGPRIEAEGLAAWKRTFDRGAVVRSRDGVLARGRAQREDRRISE